MIWRSKEPDLTSQRSLPQGEPLRPVRWRRLPALLRPAAAIVPARGGEVPQVVRHVRGDEHQLVGGDQRACDRPRRQLEPLARAVRRPIPPPRTPLGNPKPFSFLTFSQVFKTDFCNFRRCVEYFHYFFIVFNGLCFLSIAILTESVQESNLIDRTWSQWRDSCLSILYTDNSRCVTNAHGLP